MKLTPMLAQYLSVKAQAGDAVLFFRLGDFYEMFFEDAERVAPLLDLTLTSRNKDAPDPIPMCGVPCHAAQGYVSRLLELGVKVAICDQLGDAQSQPGLVERGLTRIITPGTVLDEDEGLEASSPAYLAALARGAGDSLLIAVVEAATGELRCCRAASAAVAVEEVGRIAPRELIVPEGDDALAELARASGATVTARPAADARAPAALAAVERLCAEAREPAAIEADARAALGALIAYLGETVRGDLAHLRPPRHYALADRLLVDARTLRNLAVVEGAGGGRHGSLWWAIDRTATAMGARRLRDWLVAPLLDLGAIGARLDAVEALVEAPGLRADLAEALRPIGDLERLVARIGIGRAGPRELARLGHALERLEGLSGVLGAATLPPLLERVAGSIVPPRGLGARLGALLADSPPLAAAEGGAIRDGADAEVDRLRGLKQNAQGLLAELEAREREATGIASLKVRYQRVFGYFFEVTKANLRLVPDRFTRRQTLASGERFTTPELLELERELTGADELCRQREIELVTALLGEVRSHEAALSRAAFELANLDVLAGLAAVAHDQGYVRPEVHRGSRLSVRDGRHPVVERTSAAGRFVPNDALLDDAAEQILILTGPNMAGKSTYLRQVALLALLAHVGSFVPAAAAEIPLTDRIWTRVGASDDLVAGDSTFMVEMKETAAILANLTPRSLVVLDEIGRGTSTYDGIAIAWAVAEYLHDLEPGPGGRVKTLFATHFHELTALAESLPRVRNASVAVREWRGDVVFLRKVVPGPASRSYGVAVARLAGVPPPVVERAKALLAALEAGQGAAHGPPKVGRGPTEPTSAQLDLFAPAGDRLRHELAAIDVDRLTPLEALQTLHDLVQRARE